MRPFGSNLSGVPRRIDSVPDPESIQGAPTDPALGTPQAREEVAGLMQRLLPRDRTSRARFLGLATPEPVVRQVDLKTMVGLVIGAWVLEQSMSLRSSNHKSSAADDAYRGRDLVTRYAYRYGREAMSDVMRHAREIAFTGTGPCGRHAAHNFALLGGMLSRLHGQCPSLRAHLPSVELVVDETAGTRLGGPDGDVHAYVLIQGGTVPVLVDSWVLFPRLHEASLGVYEASSEAASTFSVPANVQELPGDVIDQLAEMTELRPDEPPLLGEESYRDADHWLANNERLRGWQQVSSCADDVATVYVCGDLVFDPDQMGQGGLEIRKHRAQEAAYALDVGGQSPIRGAPELSPLRFAPADDSDDNDDVAAEPSSDDSDSSSNN